MIDSYSGKEVVLVKLNTIEAVLHRPGMYTMNGTFAEAIAYMEGLYDRYHMQNGWLEQKGYPVPDENKLWREFMRWLTSGSEPYLDVLRRIQVEHGNGQEACLVLTKLFEKFEEASRVTGG